jgi:hypothetical protein
MVFSPGWRTAARANPLATSALILLPCAALKKKRGIEMTNVGLPADCLPTAKQNAKVASNRTIVRSEEFSMAVHLSRRQFLGAAAMAVAAVPDSFKPAMAKQLPEQSDAAAIPIIDTHIHLFDPARPQGVPWPPKNNPVAYKPALPARFREVTKDLGIVGAIAVECSPWLKREAKQPQVP